MHELLLCGCFDGRVRVGWLISVHGAIGGSFWVALGAVGWPQAHKGASKLNMIEGLHVEIL